MKLKIGKEYYSESEKWSTDRFFCFDAEELMRAVLTLVHVAERSRVADVTWYKRNTIHLVFVQHFLKGIT